MRAAMLREFGGPEQFLLEDVALPSPGHDQVLIRVRAFGLNRAEVFTRQGHSADVALPRILGIEAVGTVEEAPAGGFQKGETVACVMGGMGRSFNGSYAEYTVIPAVQLISVKTTLAWPILGSLPELLQTAWGALYTALQLQPGEQLLIRGGTTSVGLAAMALAKLAGAVVVTTTRNTAHASFLRQNGADHVIIDSGSIQEELKRCHPEGVDKVLDLVGTSTLLDSLQCAKKRGMVCGAGIAGNGWVFKEFEPALAIPTAVYFTTYSGTSADFFRMPFEALVKQVEDGSLRIPLARTFPLEEISAAHRFMEGNQALGKIVVLP